MAVTMKIACMVLFCMVVAVTVTEAITCSDITPNLYSCIPYLQNGGSPGNACCSGITAVKNLAKTTPDNQIACGCLKTAANAFGIDRYNALYLSLLCNVRLPYPFSARADCSKIKDLVMRESKVE